MGQGGFLGVAVAECGLGLIRFYAAHVVRDRRGEHTHQRLWLGLCNRCLAVTRPAKRRHCSRRLRDLWSAKFGHRSDSDPQLS